MSFTVGISKLLGLRHQHGDQAVLDLLQLAMLLNYAPGIVTTEQLRCLIYLFLDFFLVLFLWA